MKPSNITDISEHLPRFGADQLIQKCRQEQPAGNLDPYDFIDNLPVVLQSALELLLEQVDYHEEIASSQAIAARLLALTVVRLEEQQYRA
ncbi:MAG: hypothetical protein ABW090_17610 [Sedimenticola sp.]